MNFLVCFFFKSIPCRGCSVLESRTKILESNKPGMWWRNGGRIFKQNIQWVILWHLGKKGKNKSPKRFICEEIYIILTGEKSPITLFQQWPSNIQNSNILNVSIRQCLEKQLLSNSNKKVPQVAISLVVKIIQAQRLSLKLIFV